MTGAVTTPEREFTFKLVGVTFVKSYPENLYTLEKVAAERGVRLLSPLGAPMHDGLEASLIREPDNVHDANAIAVLACGHVIGHVPRDMAARIAPDIDAGRHWLCSVVSVVHRPEHAERPGVWIKCWRTS